MFILTWFLHEIVLTYQELRLNITIPHIFTGIVLYNIVHFAAKRGQMIAMREQKLFKNVVQARIYNHIHSRHQGKPSDCPDCATIVIVEDF